jgi:hypothetical protein
LQEHRLVVSALGPVPEGGAHVVEEHHPRPDPPVVRVPIADQHPVDRDEGAAGGLLQDRVGVVVQVDGHRVGDPGRVGDGGEDELVVGDVAFQWGHGRGTARPAGGFAPALTEFR